MWCRWHKSIRIRCPLDLRCHRALLSYGVTGYSAEDCWDDYVYGLLQTPVLGIFGWMYGTRTARGDEMFALLMRRSCRAIADHDALAVVRGGL